MELEYSQSIFLKDPKQKSCSCNCKYISDIYLSDCLALRTLSKKKKKTKIVYQEG